VAGVLDSHSPHHSSSSTRGNLLAKGEGGWAWHSPWMSTTGFQNRQFLQRISILAKGSSSFVGFFHVFALFPHPEHQVDVC
jgi:hypothetical protein